MFPENALKCSKTCKNIFLGEKSQFFFDKQMTEKSKMNIFAKRAKEKDPQNGFI